ncbi:MAG: class I SAM-dependent methyltransferase [Patescibacteria group bacterium]
MQYSIEQLDEALREIDGEYLCDDERHAEMILETLQTNWFQLEKKRVLDVGAGNGEFVRAARNRDIECYGIEKFGTMGLANKLIAIIRELCKREFQYNEFDMARIRKSETIDKFLCRMRRKIKKVTGVDMPSLADETESLLWKNRYLMHESPYFIGHDACTIPFKDEYFDVALSHAAPPGSSGYTTDKQTEQIFTEIMRVLGPNGKFTMAPGKLDIHSGSYSRGVECKSNTARVAGSRRSLREVAEEKYWRERLGLPQLTVRYYNAVCQLREFEHGEITGCVFKKS